MRAEPEVLKLYTVSLSKFLTGFLLVFLFAFMHDALAFESAEHKAVGDLALMLMREAYCPGTDATQAGMCKVLQNIDGKREKGPSYGDIVACVDFFLTPEKLMSGFGESKNHLIQTWPTGKCTGTDARKFQAAHSNHTHFQHELLVSLHTYHELAVSMARDTNNLEGALLMNAIADHYLQDFFSPGHITTRRDRLSDLFANAMHDAANEDGATFHVAGASGLPGVRAKVADILKVAFANPPQGDSAHIEKLQTFLKGSDPAAFDCKSAEDVFAKGEIILKGDDLLGWNNGCRQRLLMLAANMLSIEDVLQAGKQQSFYREYDFDYKDAKDWTILQPFTYLPSIDAQLPFGFYALGNNPKVINNDHDKYLPLARRYVIGFSLAEEQFSNGTGVARTAGLLEFVPFGAVSPGYFGNYGLALGAYGYGGSADVMGLGVSARLGFIIPESESTLSIGVRRVHHTGSVMDEWGTGWSVRYDQGYSSFFSLFISAGRDFAAETNSLLSFGTYLSAGFMVAAPTSRISAKSIKNFFGE